MGGHMGKVMKSNYRRPLTPGGIKGMEKRTLKWFDHEMFSNFNTGTLEQYLEEKNRKDSFRHKAWDTRKVLFGLLLGCVFSVINMYVGLKVGMVIAGSMYIIYLTGMALKWAPAEINLTSTISNGAAMICTGFVFTFPAIYILQLQPIGIHPDTGQNVVGEVPPVLIAVAILATILSGILGVMYFIIFRRIWLVTDPLPMPGFEANVKMMDMARSVSGEEAKIAKASVNRAMMWIGGTFLFTMARDMLWIDKALGYPKWYRYGDIGPDISSVHYTHLTFTLVPIQFGIGWFMKFRTALLISAGTAFTWLFVVPLAVAMHVPVYDPLMSQAAGEIMFMDVAMYTGAGSPMYVSAAAGAFDIARVMAIGVILGGGFTALIKMAPVFRSITTVLMATRRKGDGEGGARESAAIRSGSFIPGKGWYDWPAEHIKIMLGVAFIGTSFAFIVGGFPTLPSLAFSTLLVLTTFFLGAIAVKVMGETGTEPVSATSFVVLILLMGTFLYGLKTDISDAVIMALIGTTVFAGAISMSGDIIMDFKNGMYCGNRPSQLVKGLTLGIVPGAIISGSVAVVLSIGLAEGTLELAAPQARAFSMFTMIIATGNVDWSIFILGIIIGIFVELLLGMGTAFGLGMYFPFGLQMPMLVGGAARDWWEQKKLEPTAVKEGWSEKRRTLKLMDTYIMATGLIIGEAVAGTVLAIYFVLG